MRLSSSNLVQLTFRSTESEALQPLPRLGNIPAPKPQINYVSGSHEYPIDVPRPSRSVAKALGLSQLQLALSTGFSQRHVSFLELGRTKPSGEMVLRLAAALDVPLRNSNELLLLAGYAPVWAETGFGTLERTPVRDAPDHILATRTISGRGRGSTLERAASQPGRYRSG
jgi:transcriptional regulator with XRE-family HTH domain